MSRTASTRREFLRTTATVAAGTMVPYWFAARSAHAEPLKSPLKIYIHCDMEGTSGLFKRDQTWYKEKGVPKEVGEEGIKLMVADVNAATAAALKAGVDGVIVCDTHGGGGNLRPEAMLADPRVTYHFRSRGTVDGKLRWMPNLDEASGLILMGHHAKAGTEHAFLAHTNNLEWLDFSINGQSVGEIGIESCYAGHWNVSPIMVHGDEALGKEAEALFPGVVTACVKRAVSYELAEGLDADAAHKLVAEKVAEAIDKLRAGKMKPYRPTLPMLVRLRFKSESGAEKAARKPGAQRIDEHTVQCEVKSHGAVVKWLSGDGMD